MVDDQPVGDLDDLRRCRQPALVLPCDHDPLHPMAVSQAIVAALPRASALTLPPRYLRPDDHTRALVTTMAAFLAQADRR